MTKTKVEAAASLPAGFGFGEVSGRPSAAERFASLMKIGRRRSQARAEAEVRRCGHLGVLEDYLSAKSHTR